MQCPSHPKASDGDVVANIGGTGLWVMRGDAGFWVGLVAAAVVLWDTFAFLENCPCTVAKLEAIRIVN